MIYNSSRRSIFENYEELRKPEKNTQPQLPMNYQTASSIILADSVTDLKNISQSKAAQDETELKTFGQKALCTQFVFN